MTRIIICTCLCLAGAAFSQGDVATVQRQLEDKLARQEAKFTTELNANREWMQQMTREFEAQNELIRKLHKQIAELQRELAVTKSQPSGVTPADLARVQKQLDDRIDSEAAARIAADKQLAKGVASEIARAAKAAAQSRPEPRPRPTPTANTIQYTVEPGDTLSVIARAFETSVSRIKSLNGLNSDVIRVGQKLKVPVPAN